MSDRHLQLLLDLVGSMLVLGVIILSDATLAAIVILLGGYLVGRSDGMRRTQRKHRDKEASE